MEQYSEEPTIRVRRFQVLGGRVHKGDLDGMDVETVVHVAVEGERYPGPTPLAIASERLTLDPANARALGQKLMEAADALGG